MNGKLAFKLANAFQAFASGIGDIGKIRPFPVGNRLLLGPDVKIEPHS